MTSATINSMIGIIALFPVVIMAAALLLPLLWSRDGLLLGIHVSPEFLATPNAQRILRNYTVGAVLTGLLGIALAILGVADNRPLLLIAAEIFEVVGLIILGVTVIVTLRSHRPGNHLRSAFLTKEQPQGGWLLSTLAALLPLAGVAALLASRWQTLPIEFPVHWGIDGQPNGWSARTPAGIFGPLIAGAAIIVLLAMFGELVSRTSAGFAGRPAFLGLTRNALRAAAWLLAFVFGGVALLPITFNPSRTILWVVMGSFAFSAGLIAYIVVRARRMQGVMAAAQDSTPDRFWKAGVFYYNPADPALMVPKRLGIGYTLNFAHPMAWILLGGTLIIALALPLLLHISKK